MNKIMIILQSLLVLVVMQSCAQSNHQSKSSKVHKTTVNVNDDNSFSNAYFASGCFWCAEAIFESVKGVQEVISGYSGGKKENATYDKIGTGKTAHAEAIRVIYDSTMISYPTLLQVFFGSHDPTTLNRQGPDYGPQYRSVVFYQNEEEKRLTFNYIELLNDSGNYAKKIVTEVSPLSEFYPAEDYHQNFEKLHPNNRYVKSVSIPRLNKFKKKYPKLLKKEANLKE